MDVTQTHIEKDLAHDRPLISCRFDPAGRFVFAGAEDYSVWRFDIESGAKTKLDGVDAWVRGMAFDRNGSTIVTGGYDGRLIWWPVLKKLLTLKSVSPPIRKPMWKRKAPKSI